MTASNVHDLGARIEAKRRLAKALAIHHTIVEGISRRHERFHPDLVVSMLEIAGDSEWQRLADISGVRVPSEETRKLVIDMFRYAALRETNIVKARDAANDDVDPFTRAQLEDCGVSR